MHMRCFVGTFNPHAPLLPSLRNDWWLLCGISRFIAGLYCRKAFGNTDYLHWIREEQHKVSQYELEHSLPPLCGIQLDSSAGSELKSVKSALFAGFFKCSCHVQ